MGILPMSCWIFSHGQDAHATSSGSGFKRLIPASGGSDVEAEFDDVAVLDDILFSFKAELAGFLGFRLGAE